MSWLAGKSEFQSSLGISNSSLSRDTLAISTEQIQSEPHRKWKMERRRVDHLFRKCRGGRQHIKPAVPGQITQSTANERELGY